MNETVERLRAFGWRVEPRRPVPLHLAPEVNVRFRRLPAEYIQFLEQTRCCVNAPGTAWFLTEEDFAGTSDSAFLWNEFELMSLEAAEENSDLASSITRFWELHLPIAMSTKSGYAFLALSLATEDDGKIVTGREPEFEDVEVVCSSFRELLNLLKTTETAEGTLLADFIDRGRPN